MNDFRPRTALVLRTAGVALVGVAVLVLVCLVIAVLADTGTGWVLLFAAAGVFGVGVAAVVQSRQWMVRLTDEGFQLRRIGGVGTGRGSWDEVTEVATAFDDELPTLHLLLRDDRVAVIPVGALAVDKDDFVRAVRSHLVADPG